MCLCLSGPLLVEPARLLHDGGRLAEQDGITSQAEDKISPAPMCDHFDDLGSGEMTIPADQDMGLGPVAPQIGQEPDQDHRVLSASWTLPRSEAGGHQGV